MTRRVLPVLLGVVLALPLASEGGVDMRAAISSVSPNPATCGQSITIGYSVTNSGTSAVTVQTGLKLYLSTNSTLDSSDVYLSPSVSIGTMTANGGVSGSVTRTIPATTSSGTWYIIGQADAFNAVSETNETNNTGSRSFTVTCGCSNPGSFTLSSPSSGYSYPSSTTSVTLSWNSSSGATGYDVYFGTSSNPSLSNSNVSATSVQKSVSSGQTYYWTVKARNSCGTTSTSSGTRSFSVQSSCSNPGSFSLSSPSNGYTYSSSTSTVTLTWNASSGATGYDVYFGTSSTPALSNSNVSGTSIQKSVSPGQTYYWTIVARNSCGTTASSSGTRSFAVEGTRSLTVTVRNVDANARPGALCRLYNRPSGSWVSMGTSYNRTTDSNGRVAWDGLAAGEYMVEASYSGASPFPGEEFWGNVQVTQGSSNVTATLTRNQPYATEPVEFRLGSSTGTLLTSTSQVTAGQVVWVGVRVKQQTGATATSRVRVVLDRNRDSVFDVDSGDSGAQSIPSGTTGTLFSTTFTATQTGTYYRALRVNTLVNGSYTKTDGWDWYAAFEVVQKTLAVTVQNVDGNIRAGVLCRLYNKPSTSWQPLGTSYDRTTDANGRVSWDGLASGEYMAEAYYSGASPFSGEEFWGSVQVTLGSASLTTTLTRNQPHAVEPVEFRLGTSTGTLLTPASQVTLGQTVWVGVRVKQQTGTTATSRVRVALDRSRDGTFDLDSGDSASQTVPTGSTGTLFSVTFTPTQTGTYHRTLRVSSLVGTAYTKTDAWDWYAAFEVVQKTLTVTVHNVDGNARSGALCRLYNRPSGTWQPMGTTYDRTTDANGRAAWTGLAAGEYMVEAYYSGTSPLPGEEFWGNVQVSVGTTSHAATLTRVQPYATEPVQFRLGNSTGTLLTPTSQVTLGETVWVGVRVKQQTTTAATSRMRVVLDRNRDAAFDLDSGESAPQSVPSGSIGALYSFTFTPAQSGTHYRALQVSTLVNGSYKKTDGWDWFAAFEVAPPGLDIFGSRSGEWNLSLFGGTNNYSVVRFVRNGVEVMLPFSAPYTSASASTLIRDERLGRLILLEWVAQLRLSLSSDDLTGSTTAQLASIRDFTNLNGNWWVEATLPLLVPGGAVLSKTVFNKRIAERSTIGAVSFFGADQIAKAKLSLGASLATMPLDLAALVTELALPQVDPEEMRALITYYLAKGDDRTLLGGLSTKLNTDLVDLIRSTQTAYDMYGLQEATLETIDELPAIYEAVKAVATSGGNVAQLKSLMAARLDGIYGLVAAAGVHYSGAGDFKKEVHAWGIVHDEHCDAIYALASELIDLASEIAQRRNQAATPANLAALERQENRFIRLRMFFLPSLMRELFVAQYNHIARVRENVTPALAYFGGASRASLAVAQDTKEAWEEDWQYWKTRFAETYDAEIKASATGYRAALDLLAAEEARPRVVLSNPDVVQLRAGSSVSMAVALRNTSLSTITGVQVSVPSTTSGISLSVSSAPSSIAPSADAPITILASVPYGWFARFSSGDVNAELTIPLTISYVENGRNRQDMLLADALVVPPGKVTVFSAERMQYQVGERVNFTLAFDTDRAGEVYVIVHAFRPDGTSAGLGGARTSARSMTGYFDITDARFGSYGFRVTVTDSAGQLLLPETACPRTFVVMPVLAGQDRLDYQHLAIVGSQSGDGAVVNDFAETLGISSDAVVWCDGLSAAQLLQRIAGKSAVLVGGDQANPLVQSLVQSGRLAAGKWNRAGDASVDFIADAFGAGQHVVIVAGYRDRDTEVAGLALAAYIHKNVTRVPAVSSIEPAQATVGSGPISLTVEGAGFVNGLSKVMWNNSERPTTFVSTTELSALIPPSDLASAGTATVTVWSAPPGGGTSNGKTFTIGNPIPVISAIDPAEVVAGSPSFALGVAGSGFVNGAKVLWNGQERATSWVSASALTATILQSDVATAGVAAIRVVNPAPGGGTSGSKPLTVVPPPDVTVSVVATDPDASEAMRNTATFELTLSAPRSSTITVTVGLSGTATPQADYSLASPVPGVIVDGSGGIIAVPAGTTTVPIVLTPVDDSQPEGLETVVVTLASSAGVSVGDPASATVTIADNDAAAFDFNGDGRGDVVWRHRTTGEIVIWLMNGAASTSYLRPPTEADTAWRIAAAGDFNGDGKMDLVWRHAQSGANRVWLMNGETRLGVVSVTSVADANWRIVAADDFNADGKTDLLWRHALTGENAFWLMNGTVRAGTATLPTVTDRAWEIAGTGDFNADAAPDILWHNRTTGECVVWTMQGISRLGATAFASVKDALWRVVQVADFDGDSKPDLLWRHTSTGENVVWLMDGLRVRSNPKAKTVASDWDVLQTPFVPAIGAGAHDFNGDGKPDVFFRHQTTGENIVWFMNGVANTGYGRLKALADPSWKAVALADFDGNGKPDVLWRNQATGENIVWYLNGVSYVSYARVASVTDANWHIAGAADFTGDNKPDLLWRNAATGENIVWHMNDAVTTGYTRLKNVVGSQYELAAAADFTGDGKTDILWRNTTTGESIVWEMNGTASVGHRVINRLADATWQVGMAADFNGDGKTDILLRSTTTGENIVWYLNGTLYAGYGRVQTVADANWRIVPGQR